MSFSSADYADVLGYFKPEHVADESCHPSSPVFQCLLDGQRAVIKRTSAPLTAGEAIVRWVDRLDTLGVPVVTALPLRVQNPVQIDGDVWVAYPWIDGRAYDRSAEDLTAAGELLGRLHSVDIPDIEVVEFAWPERSHAEDNASIEEDLVGLTEALSANIPEFSAAALQNMEMMLRRFMSTTMPTIRSANLPTLPVSLDYKANNLVFVDGSPVLVDPDNGERAPRLLDLALAALLFYYESPTAPGRLFDDAEWDIFRGAYLKNVELTEAERELWPLALEYMYCEWVIWTVIDADTWDQPRQKTLMQDLVTVKFDRFPLLVT